MRPVSRSEVLWMNKILQQLPLELYLMQDVSLNPDCVLPFLGGVRFRGGGSWEFAWSESRLQPPGTMRLHRAFGDEAQKTHPTQRRSRCVSWGKRCLLISTKMTLVFSVRNSLIDGKDKPAINRCFILICLAPFKTQSVHPSHFRETRFIRKSFGGTREINPRCINQSPCWLDSGGRYYSVPRGLHEVWLM